MKVSFYIDNLVRDGAERVTIYVADYLSKKGIETTIFTLNKAKVEYNVPVGVKRVILYEKSHNRYIHLPCEILRFRNALKKIDPDVLIVMDNTASVLAVPACTGLRTKVVISERNDPTHFAGHKLTQWLSHLFMKKADGFVFQTPDAKKYYDTMLNGKGAIIPNPIINTLPLPQRNGRDKTIVSVGRLNPQKNQEILIDAFAKIHQEYPQYKLIIYGEGVLRENLEQKIRNLKLDNVISLPGNKSNVLELILNAYMFVFSSNFEGMPNALMEAMAMGLPCISTDCPCGGPRYLITQNENGILVKVGDSEEIGKQMKYLIDHPDIAREIGEKAVSIRQTLDMTKVGALWFDYIKTLIH